jgi:hypothetical protein
MKLLSTLPLLIAILFLSSCQQDIDELPPMPPVDTLTQIETDSTQLIKSILFTTVLNAGVPESLRENYFYDTVNNRINVSWEGEDGMSRSRRSQVGASLDASRLRALGGGSRNGLLLLKLLFEGVASR